MSVTEQVQPSAEEFKLGDWVTWEEGGRERSAQIVRLAQSYLGVKGPGVRKQITWTATGLRKIDPPAAADTADGTEPATAPETAEPCHVTAPAPLPVEIRAIPLGELCPFQLQPRTEFNPVKLQELATSLRERGQLEPILVRPANPKHGLPTPFEIIAGGRRFEAALLAQLPSLVAVVRDVDDRTALALATEENAHRADLNPIEQCRNVLQLEAYNYSRAEIAQFMGVSPDEVSHLKRLNALPAAVQAMVKDGRLSGSHARRLVRFAAAPKLCIALAERVISERLSVRMLEGDDLPHSWDLRNDGLVKGLNGTLFDVKRECDDCPYGARFGVWCGNPKHWDELQSAAQEAEAEKVRQAQERITAEARERLKLAMHQAERAERTEPPATEGTESATATEPDASPHGTPAGLVRTSDLKWGTYERVYVDCPAACTVACDCRVAALAHDGTAVQICLNPERYAKLKAAEVKETTAQRKQRFTAILDGLSKQNSVAWCMRALAVMFWEAIRQTSVASRRAVADAHPDLRPEFAAFLREPSYQHEGAKVWPIIEQETEGRLMMLAGEILARESARLALDAKSDVAPRLTYLAGATDADAADLELPA